MGGKAANLSRLMTDYPVPPGFCLTTNAFALAHRSGAPAAQLPRSRAFPSVIASRLAIAEEIGKHQALDLICRSSIVAVV
ncbi:MAG: hypothetical protein ABI901_00150 [Roseiflexaceae bacterium]